MGMTKALEAYRHLDKALLALRELQPTGNAVAVADAQGRLLNLMDVVWNLLTEADYDEFEADERQRNN